MYATQTAQATATDAVQVFGGRGITRTGMGQFIEHVRFAAPITARNLVIYFIPCSTSITEQFHLTPFSEEVSDTRCLAWYIRC